MKSDLLRLCGVALLTLPALHAQLYIDAAGPRNLLVSAKGNGQPEADKWVAKFDSEKKGVSAGYFASRDDETKFATRTLGFLGQVSSPNGWDEVFKAPTVEASALYNYTWSGSSGSGSRDSSAGPWFFNASVGYRRDNLQLRATAADPVIDKTLDSGKATIGFGRQMNARTGLAVSARFERANNSEKLKKVEAGGRPVREGALMRSDATPIALILTREIESGFVSDLLAKWRSDQATYDLVLGLYGEYDPSVKTGNDHKFGLNLTVKRYSVPTAVDLDKRRAAVEKKFKLAPGSLGGMAAATFADISYPLSVFAEWKQPLGSNPGKLVTGVAALFTWP